VAAIHVAGVRGVPLSIFMYYNIEINILD